MVLRRSCTAIRAVRAAVSASSMAAWWVPAARGPLEFKTNFSSACSAPRHQWLNVLPRRRDNVYQRRHFQQRQAFLLVRRQHGGETFDPIDYRQGCKPGFFALQFCERISRAERIP